MAFGTKRVYYTGEAYDKLPSGHSEDTTASSLGTTDIGEQKANLTISCDGVANATKTTAIAALTTAITSAIDTLVGTTMGVDTSGNTVSYNYNVTNFVRGEVANDILLAEASDNYTVYGKLKVYVS